MLGLCPYLCCSLFFLGYTDTLSFSPQECKEGSLYSHLVFSGVDFDIVRHSHTYPG